MFKKKYIKYGSIGLAIAAVIFPATTFAGISDGLMASVSEGIGNMVAVIA